MFNNHDQDPFDDGLGEDMINHGSSKVMGTGGGGGSDIDPSYEDALRITGSSSSMPSPWEQRALMMEDAHAAELARLLTKLRNVSDGGTLGLGFEIPGSNPETLSPARAADKFINGLQDQSIKREKLTALRDEIPVENDEIRLALHNVCEFPDVKEKLSS